MARVAVEEVTISALTERRLVLENSQWAAAFSNSWNVLRIGMRMAFDDTGYGIYGDPHLYFGLINNPNATFTNGVFGMNTSHFLGYRMPDVVSEPSVSRTATYYQVSSTNCVIKKVGSTVTPVSGLSQTCYFSNQQLTQRKAMVLEITRGSPNFSVKVCVGRNTNTTDGTYEALVNAMGAASFAAVITALQADGPLYGGDVAHAVPVDEGVDGTLDHVFVAWDRKAPSLHVSEVLLSILS